MARTAAASILTDERGRHVSMVRHIFSVGDGVITQARAYRNETGAFNRLR